MAFRFAAIHLVALYAILVGRAASFAGTPLVIAELDAERAVAQADAARTSAEAELAAWRLTQLEALRSRGHASWREVAEQEVTAKSATALARASQRYLQEVGRWQSQLAKLTPQQTAGESESIGLYMPFSPRLAAWISTEVASHELSSRHLENLRIEYETASSIDLSSLESAILKARQAVEAYRRSENHAGRRSHAEIQLRLAEAECESAKARKEGSRIIARRMALINESLDEKQAQDEASSRGLARVGTRLVDATSDLGLTRLVEATLLEETLASERLALLEHRRDGMRNRIDALETLSDHLRAGSGELDQLKHQMADLESQIQRAQDLGRMQQQIAGEYQQMSESRPKSNMPQAAPVAFDDPFPAGADAVRHLLKLRQLEFQAAANCDAAQAQRDYLAERLKRVERLAPEARPPKELDHLRHQVQESLQWLAVVDHELVLLDNEQQRFRRQLQSQQGNQHQLVQIDNGAFVRREQFEIGEALIAAIGCVGCPGLFPESSTPYSYVESTTLLDCMAALSLESPLPTEILRLGGDCESCDRSLRPDVWSGASEARDSFGGLRLGAATMTCTADLFCNVPYGTWWSCPGARWASYGYCGPAGTCGFRSLYPFANCAPGLGTPSCFCDRNICPTPSTFPYDSIFPCRSAFPATSILYTSPYGRPTNIYEAVSTCQPVDR